MSMRQLRRKNIEQRKSTLEIEKRNGMRTGHFSLRSMNCSFGSDRDEQSKHHIGVGKTTSRKEAEGRKRENNMELHVEEEICDLGVPVKNVQRTRTE